jgi:hypothetical protein
MPTTNVKPIALNKLCPLGPALSAYGKGVMVLSTSLLEYGDGKQMRQDLLTP